MTWWVSSSSDFYQSQHHKARETSLNNGNIPDSQTQVVLTTRTDLNSHGTDIFPSNYPPAAAHSSANSAGHVQAQVEGRKEKYEPPPPPTSSSPPW